MGDYLKFILYLLLVNITCIATDIWLVGDSIVHWAGQRAECTGKPNLQTGKILGWYGIRGMLWTSFIHNLQLKIAFQSQPVIFFVHLDGNDITNLSLTRIFNLISAGLKYIASIFPDCDIIWCDILPRLTWGKTQVIKLADKKTSSHSLIVMADILFVLFLKAMFYQSTLMVLPRAFFVMMVYTYEMLV